MFTGGIIFPADANIVTGEDVAAGITSCFKDGKLRMVAGKLTASCSIRLQPLPFVADLNHAGFPDSEAGP